MTAPSYQLDTVAGNLIERMEGARRTWIGQPDAAASGFRRIAEETVDRVIAEHDQLLGDDGWGAVLRREVLETFLPRYVRLAQDHNELEDQGYRAWRKGDPVARIIATSVALLFAVGFARFIHSPVALLAYGLALMVPFIPEFRSWYYRRRYRALLQEVVDDMARIQEELARYPEGPSGAQPQVAEPESPRRPQPQKERIR